MSTAVRRLQVAPSDAAAAQATVIVATPAQLEALVDRAVERALSAHTQPAQAKRDAATRDGVTLDELAEQLRLSKQQTRRVIEREGIKVRRASRGGRIVVEQREVDRLLQRLEGNV